MTRKSEVELRLAPDVLAHYREIARMSGESVETCYLVMLTAHVVSQMNVMRANAARDKILGSIKKKAARPKRKRG